MKKLFHELPISIITMPILYLCLCPLPGTPAHAAPADYRLEEKAGDTEQGNHDGKNGEESAKKPDKPGTKIFGFEAGYNGSYADGTAPRSFYSQPFLNIFLKHQYVKFTAGISRFWDYQITNGAGGFETVNFTQPKISLSLYPHDVIELYGSYLYSAGDKSHYYKAHDGTAGFSLDFEVVTAGFSGNYKKTEYIFYSDDRKDKAAAAAGIAPPGAVMKLWRAYTDFKKQNTKRVEDYTLSPTFSWYIIETTSLDLNYDYYHTKFKNPYTSKNDEVYYSHTGRIGVSSEPCDYFSLTAGITAGKGSDKYITAGGDIGVTFNILDYVNLSTTYTPVYNIAPNIDPTKRKFLEIFSYVMLFGKRKNANPYMRLQDIGKSFWNQSVSFSVSFKY